MRGQRAETDEKLRAMDARLTKSTQEMEKLAFSLQQLQRERAAVEPNDGSPLSHIPVGWASTPVLPKYATPAPQSHWTRSGCPLAVVQCETTTGTGEIVQCVMKQQCADRGKNLRSRCQLSCPVSRRGKKNTFLCFAVLIVGAHLNLLDCDPDMVAIGEGLQSLFGL